MGLRGGVKRERVLHTQHSRIPHRWRVSCLLMGAAVCANAMAQTEPPAPASTPTPAARAWEGAVGLIAAYRPEYAGAARRKAKLTPAVFLRYGRLTITNASGFATRRADDVARGLALDVINTETVRLGASLRLDNGRREATSANLKGLGDIKPTVRARVSATWRVQGPWRLGASWNADLLGRGGGYLGDISAGWEQRLSPHTTLGASTTLNLGGARYMQTFYGVTPEQAQRNGSYAPYKPGAGVRDVSFAFNARHDLSADWILIGGAGASRLLGPAAQSPLAKERDGWGVSAGFAWRF
jgi:MipA family protein